MHRTGAQRECKDRLDQRDGPRESTYHGRKSNVSEAEAITASVSVPSRLSFKVAVREPAFQVVGSRLPSDFGAALGGVVS